MSMSGAFEARTSAAVVPRPARASGVRASVAPNSEWVRLSKCRNIPACEKRPSSPRRARGRALVPAPAFAWGAVGASLHHGARDRSAAAGDQAVLRALPRRARAARQRSRSVARRRVGGRAANHSDRLRRRRATARIRSPRCRASTTPRSRSSASRSFDRNGLLPWRTMEEFGNLRRIFEGFARNQLYVGGNTVLFASTLAHYIQDAHQPLHAHNNYDGQLSGQTRPPRRFERELFERFESRLTINPAPVVRSTNTRDSIFDIALASYQLVPTDPRRPTATPSAARTPTTTRTSRSSSPNIRPMLERQLAGAITATASAIVGAWDAGRQAGAESSTSRGRFRRSRSRRRLDDAAVYLVPIGSGRFELYTEPPDDAAIRRRRSTSAAGFWRRTVASPARDAGGRWRAPRTPGTACDARPDGSRAWRDWLVRRIAESIAEQRTLWSLRARRRRPRSCYPVRSVRRVGGRRQGAAARARAPSPRPVAGRSNLVGVCRDRASSCWCPARISSATTSLFRVVGHFLSWRGARQALERIVVARRARSRR